jgi:hypothetical protein
MPREDKIIYDWCNAELSRGRPSNLVFSNLDSIEKKYKIGKYEKVKKTRKKK